MAGQQKVHQNIFLFTIKQEDEGFAFFESVLKRVGAATCPTAFEEIKDGKPTKGWEVKTSEHDAGDLNMKFARDMEALIFVQLPTDKPKTVFGRKKVADVDIERKGSMIVANSQLHPIGTKPVQLCSFEIRLSDVLSSMGSGRKNVRRLPIMFDYVDTDTDLSPVLKGSHHDPIISHGGIHPPTATTMIELIEGQAP
ncbi:MAG: hypothetical protein CL804_09460 [Citromicrobium sp.]|nr:hypothetical protein [Citromicrobium sp.]